MTEHIFMGGIFRSPDDPRDLRLNMSFFGLPSVPLPAYFNLAEKPNHPPVRNQGDRGTCAGFAGATVKGFQDRIETGLPWQLSPEMVYSLARQIDGMPVDTQGTYPRCIFKVLKDFGCCQEINWKYNHTCPGLSALPDARNHRIKSYGQVNPLDHELIKQIIFQVGPLLAGVGVTLNWTQNTDTIWIIDSHKFDPELGGHAITVVGWTEDGIIIQNSWGDSWGRFGYAVLTWAWWDAHCWELWKSKDGKTKGEPA